MLQPIPIPFSLFPDVCLLFTEFFRFFTGNKNCKPRKHVLFEATPLKIKILEDNSENNDDTGSPDTNICRCSTQIDDSSENGNPSDDNFMDNWFQLITDWEKKIHLDDKRKKVSKKE